MTAKFTVMGGVCGRNVGGLWQKCVKQLNPLLGCWLVFLLWPPSLTIVFLVIYLALLGYDRGPRLVESPSERSKESASSVGRSIDRSDGIEVDRWSIGGG